MAIADSSSPDHHHHQLVTARKRHLLNLFRDAAAKAVCETDPWLQHNLPSIPAERVIRHLWDAKTQTWHTDETIVKIQKEPFTHGAMRFCYRLKKKATLPQSSTNHHFHSYGWSRASNYVAKACQTNGVIDTTEKAKAAVQNDVVLQCEAAHWAEQFNTLNPPRVVNFIRACAMEFPDRPGKPWFAVERFIAGKDSYGAGFVKHNTNAGFVDADYRRVTPQVFSAYSFYASEGTRLVADIQGVGDLYTDPQVLSDSYQFGDGDLGPRGMALFFKNFRHCTYSDQLGIPIFPLSRNEKKHQIKYHEDESTISDDHSYFFDEPNESKKLDKLARLDLNRQRRSMLLKTPPRFLVQQEEEEKETARVSNVSLRDEVHVSFISPLSSSSPSPRRVALHRSTSDTKEIQACLALARQDFVFDHRAFHRKESGELIHRIKKNHIHDANERNNWIKATTHRHGIVAAPMLPTSKTRENLGKVHYQLAVLHGMGRFPEIVPDHVEESQDVLSVLFHLAHATSLNNVPACLAIARVQAGLETCVSPLLSSVVPVDFDCAKELLHRAMESPYPPAQPKAASGCLLYQIIKEERTSPLELTSVVEKTLELLAAVLEETKSVIRYQKRQESGKIYCPGDHVQANYALEGTFYPAVVQEVMEDDVVIVKYDDDGSLETLTKDNVRPIVPPTATQTTMGGPLSDEEALGAENSDEKCLLPLFQLKAELADLKLAQNQKQEAAKLLEEAADEALANGKMNLATEWSLRAANLLEELEEVA